MLIFPFTLNENLPIIILTQVKFLFLSSLFFNQPSLYYKSALLSFLSITDPVLWWGDAYSEDSEDLRAKGKWS